MLYDLAGAYACPIAATNGHSRGFLITKVAPRLQPGQRILYLGDWDHCGHQIENTTRATLVEHSDWEDETDDDELWERVALTTAQVDMFGLRSKVISKPDRRYRPVRHFDAVETEAFGQRNIVNTLRIRLDELMPEPLDDVLERQRIERAEVIAHLHEMG